MKGILLLAGIGSRIRPLTDNTPKSLLEIGGKTILERMIENLSTSGIKEYIAITGYMEERIQAYCENKFPRAFTFIQNERYLDTNTGYSLLLAENKVRGESFIKLDGDVVFEPTLMDKLVNDSHETCLCMDTQIHLDKEEVKVSAASNGKVVAVGKKLDPKTSTGESIGIEKIGATAGDVLFTELKRLMQDPKNHKEYYDDSYTTLVHQGIPFHTVDVTGLKWVEIDTHDDYYRAITMFS